MNPKTKIALYLIALVFMFALGRFAAPTKEKIVVQTIEVEKKQEEKQADKERNKKKKTETHVITRPDGTQESTTTTEEETTTAQHNQSSQSSESDKTHTDSKEITRDSGKVTVSAMLGIPLSFSGVVTPVYGASVTRPVLGPIAIGVWGLSNGTVGMSAGLSF